MAYIVKHKGIQASFPINPDTLTGDPSVDINNAYIKSLVGGSLVTLDTKGQIKLCEVGVRGVGILVLNATDFFYGNVPAISQGRKMAVTIGDSVGATTQFTQGTYNPGDKLTPAGAGVVEHLS